MRRPDGRRFVREVLALVREVDGRLALAAPLPGLWRGAPAVGARIPGGAALGEIEVLGRLHRVLVPDDASGTVVSIASPGVARVAVAHGATLAVLDPNAGAPAGPRPSRSAAALGQAGLVFKTPLGGRYYARPAPNAEAFVKVGDEVGPGTTLAIVEVMKTFNRVQYGGPTLPPRAKITRIVRKDGDDVASGDALLELEALA